MMLRVWIWIVAAIAASAPGVAAAACKPAHGHPCATELPVVNFNLVPGITKDIVMAEPMVVPPPKVSAPAEPETTPYTGPTVGVNKNERAPTIGYHWSVN